MKSITLICFSVIQVVLILGGFYFANPDGFIVSIVFGIGLIVLNGIIMDYGNRRKLFCPICGKDVK